MFLDVGDVAKASVSLSAASRRVAGKQIEGHTHKCTSRQWHGKIQRNVKSFLNIYVVEDRKQLILLTLILCSEWTVVLPALCDDEICTLLSQFAIAGTWRFWDPLIAGIRRNRFIRFTKFKLVNYMQEKMLISWLISARIGSIEVLFKYLEFNKLLRTWESDSQITSLCKAMVVGKRKTFCLSYSFSMERIRASGLVLCIKSYVVSRAHFG